MSIQRSFRRVMSVLGLVLFFAATASAQIRARVPADGPFLPAQPNEPPSTGQYSEPDFVPYVNDLQLFDQPDLSPYGRGPRPPEGWFGSASYLAWAIQSPQKMDIGSDRPGPYGPGVRAVYGPGTQTANSGNLTRTLITQTNIITTTTTNVTPIGGIITVTTTTTQIFPTSIRSPGVASGFYNPSIDATTGGTIINNSFVLQSNSLNTGFMDSDFTSGGRFEFGRLNDDRGWMVSGFNMAPQVSSLQTTNVAINFENGPIGFVDVRGGVPNASTPGNFNNPQFLGDGYDDDLDGDGIYGRHGLDRGTRAGNVFNPPLDGIPDPDDPSTTSPTSIDYDDAVPLPTVFESMRIENRTSLYGVEAMRLWRVGMGPRGGIWELFVGPRFMNVRDNFTIDGRGPDTNNQYYLNPLGDTYVDTRSDNNLLGGQLGARWFIQRDRWQLSIESRFMAAANFQSTRQIGQFGSLYSSVVPTPNGTLVSTVPLRDDVTNAQLPHEFFTSAHSTQFSPLGEFRANLKYQVFRSLYLDFGYTAIYTTGIARSSSMVRYSFPNMGLWEDQNRSNLFAHGFNFGIVVNR